MKEILRKICEYCEKANWDEEKIKTLAIEIGMSVEELIERAKKYQEIKEVGKKLDVINPILLKTLNKETYYLWENIKEKEIVLKYIFNYFVKVSLEQNEIEKLAKKLSLTSETLKKYYKYYISEYLTESQQKEIKLFEEKVAKKKRELLNKQKQEDLIKKGLSLPNTNPALLEVKHKKVNVMWEDENDRIIVLKYIYDYCVRNLFSRKYLKSLSERFGFHQGIKLIEKYAKEYALTYLHMSEEEYEQKRKEYSEQLLISNKQNMKNNKKIIYERILASRTVEEVVKIVDNCNFTSNELKSALVDYIIVHQNNDEEKERILKEKLSEYTAYKSKQSRIAREKQEKIIREQEKEAKLQTAIKTIEYFITKTHYNNIEEFCDDFIVNRELFSYYVELIREKQPELYEKYLERKKQIQSKSYAIITKDIKYIIHLLKTGIEENGITRQFDLIDYYLITKMDLNEINQIAKQILNSSDQIIFKKFIIKYLSSVKTNYKDIKEILSEKIEINCEKDERGISIPGTGQIVPIETKEKLIEYLKQNQIPVNRKTYTLVFRRYINGYLGLNEQIKAK